MSQQGSQGASVMDGGGKGPSRVTRYWLPIAVLTVVGVAGIWLWSQVDQQRAQIAQLNSQLAGHGNTLQQRLDELRTTSEGRLADIAQHQQQLDTTLDTLFSRLGNTQRDLRIAEAEELINIANYRLQLSRDLETARAALRLADESLKKAADPSLTNIRTSLGKEIAALEISTMPDYIGLATELAGLELLIDELPLRARTQPVASEMQGEQVAATGTEQTSAWQRFWSAVWEALGKLVTIRRNDQPLEPLLTAEQQDNVRTSLKLKLEEARLAVLQAEPKLYQDTLQLAQQWTQTKFDSNDGRTRRFLQRVQQLQNLDITPRLPDISRSLQEIRAFRQKVGRS